MNNMRSLYIIVFVLVLCNIALTGSASFTKHLQWDGAWMTDTVDTVANGSSLAVDSLSKDSLAVDSLSKDSLAVDSLAKDSLAVDSLSKDSLAVDSLAKDSLAVDTLAKDSLAVDSIARFVVQPKKRVYVYFKEKPEPDADQKKIEGFIALYKKNISNKTVEGYAAAYLPWKGAFEGCNRRTLDMYMDGIGIILNLVRKDTLEHKYDKLTERREQMMELYDLAVDNLDDLNAQIDRKRTSDTLSVAKLRAAQVIKYRDCWILDSIFNGNDTIHNEYSDSTRVYWIEKLRKSDSVSLEMKYKCYKDIVFSSENNIFDYNVFNNFSIYFRRYAAKEVRRLHADSTAAANTYIMTHLKPEFDSIIQYTNNRFAEYENVRKNVKGTDLAGLGRVTGNMEKNFFEVKKAFVTQDRGPIDIDKLAAPFIARKEQLGGYNKDFAAEVKEESRLLKHWIYLEALVWWYNNEEATFDLAEQITKSARAQKNFNVAAQYYEKLANDPMLYMEFEELSAVKKSEIHYMAALCYQAYDASKNTAKKLDNLMAAVKITPQYYRAYELMGNIMFAYAPKVNLGSKIPKEIQDKIAYYHAYDKYNEALKAYKEFSANPENFEGIDEDPDFEKTIKKNISAAYSRFMSYTFLFQRGCEKLIGEQISITFGSKNKFTSTIRTAND